MIKNYLKKTIKPFYYTISFIIIFFISNIIWSILSVNNSPEVQEETYKNISVPNGKIIKDTISLSYYWLNGRGVIQDKRYSFINGLSSKEFSSDKGFAFSVISIINNGNEEKNITLNNFSSKNSNGIIYYPYYFLSDKVSLDFIINEKGEKIKVFSKKEPLTISVPSNKTEKIAILFEFPLETKSSELMLDYK